MGGTFFGNAAQGARGRDSRRGLIADILLEWVLLAWIAVVCCLRAPTREPAAAMAATFAGSSS
eukprot:8518389-Prorocentrum_lima.AAC.1